MLQLCSTMRNTNNNAHKTPTQKKKLIHKYQNLLIVKWKVYTIKTKTLDITFPSVVKFSECVAVFVCMHAWEYESESNRNSKREREREGVRACVPNFNHTSIPHIIHLWLNNGSVYQWWKNYICFFCVVQMKETETEETNALIDDCDQMMFATYSHDLSATAISISLNRSILAICTVLTERIGLMTKANRFFFLIFFFANGNFFRFCLFSVFIVTNFAEILAHRQ